MSTLVEQELETITCGECGVIFAIPSFLKSQLLECHNNFYCPNGHCRHFINETEAEKLRIELDRTKQERDRLRTKEEKRLSKKREYYLKKKSGG